MNRETRRRARVGRERPAGRSPLVSYEAGMRLAGEMLEALAAGDEAAYLAAVRGAGEDASRWAAAALGFLVQAALVAGAQDDAEASGLLSEMAREARAAGQAGAISDVVVAVMRQGGLTNG